MAPKGSQRSSQASKKQLKGIQQLCNTLSREIGNDETIELSDDLGKLLTGDLRVLRTRNARLPKALIDAIIAGLDIDSDVCERLTPHLYGILVQVFLQAEDCRSAARGLYLLACSLHSEPLTHGLMLRKEEIGSICWKLVLEFFLDNTRPDLMRLWALTLFIQLMQSCDKNVERITSCAEDTRRSLGTFLLELKNEHIRFQCGKLLRSLFATEMSEPSQFWPVGTDPKIYQSFPIASQADAHWNSDFNEWVDETLSITESSQMTGQDYFAQHLQTVPEYTVGTSGHNININIDEGKVSILAPMCYEEFDHLLEIPTSIIRDAKITQQGQSQIQAATITLYLNHENGQTCYIDCVPVSLTQISYVVLDLEDVNEMNHELYRLCGGQIEDSPYSWETIPQNNLQPTRHTSQSYESVPIMDGSSGNISQKRLSSRLVGVEEPSEGLNQNSGPTIREGVEAVEAANSGEDSQDETLNANCKRTSRNHVAEKAMLEPNTADDSNGQRAFSKRKPTRLKVPAQKIANGTTASNPYRTAGPKPRAKKPIVQSQITGSGRSQPKHPLHRSIGVDESENPVGLPDKPRMTPEEGLSQLRKQLPLETEERLRGAITASEGDMKKAIKFLEVRPKSPVPKSVSDEVKTKAVQKVSNSTSIKNKSRLGLDLSDVVFDHSSVAANDEIPRHQEPTMLAKGTGPIVAKQPASRRKTTSTARVKTEAKNPLKSEPARAATKPSIQAAASISVKDEDVAIGNVGPAKRLAPIEDDEQVLQALPSALEVSTTKPTNHVPASAGASALKDANVFEISSDAEGISDDEDEGKEDSFSALDSEPATPFTTNRTKATKPTPGTDLASKLSDSLQYLGGDNTPSVAAELKKIKGKTTTDSVTKHLVDDHAARKPAIVAFNAKGAKNQGSSSTEKRKEFERSPPTEVGLAPSHSKGLKRNREAAALQEKEDQGTEAEIPSNKRRSVSPNNSGASENAEVSQDFQSAQSSPAAQVQSMEEVATPHQEVLEAPGDLQVVPEPEEIIESADGASTQSCDDLEKVSVIPTERSILETGTLKIRARGILNNSAMSSDKLPDKEHASDASGVIEFSKSRKEAMQTIQPIREKYNIALKKSLEVSTIKLASQDDKKSRNSFSVVRREQKTPTHKSLTQGSRVDENGSPIFPKKFHGINNVSQLVTGIKHTARLQPEVIESNPYEDSQAEDNRDEVDENQEEIKLANHPLIQKGSPGIFGPRIHLSGISKSVPSLSKDTSERYVLHSTQKDGHYIDMLSKNVVHTEQEPADPFVRGAISGAGSSFMQRLVSSGVKRKAGVQDACSEKPLDHPVHALEVLETIAKNNEEIDKDSVDPLSAEETLVEDEISTQIKPRKNKRRRKQDEEAPSGAEAGDGWTVAIRSHYTHLHEAIRDIADEVQIKFGAEERALRLLHGRFESNGNKLVDQHMENRASSQNDMADDLSGKKATAIALYERSLNALNSTKDNVRTCSIQQTEKKWQKQQDLVQNEINKGRKLLP